MVRLGPVAWIFVSVLLHALVFARSCDVRIPQDERSPFKLPTEVEFGLADKPAGGGDAKGEPPPAPQQPKPAPRRVRAVKPARDPDAYGAAAAKQPAAASGAGEAADSAGEGLGSGMGAGSGFAPAGATIALNVDLQRIRKTALLLETESLLNVVPEWQAMLAGSGIDALRDLSRVFVASPTLERSNVVVAADHRLARARVEAAVAQLASEQGQPAAFHQQAGYPVAAWRNRGPTERSIALTGEQQFTITRTSDLERVLQVADSLTDIRKGQEVSHGELERHGGLLAMEEREAVALWVEGVQKYVRTQSPGVPSSVRLSLFPVDQFSTELRIRAQYPSAARATEAQAVLEGWRRELSEHPRVIFLGLKSAVDAARVEQLGAALRLTVKLTLHQTRHLMGYVTRTLKPRK